MRFHLQLKEIETRGVRYKECNIMAEEGNSKDERKIYYDNRALKLSAKLSVVTLARPLLFNGA